MLTDIHTTLAQARLKDSDAAAYNWHRFGVLITSLSLSITVWLFLSSFSSGHYLKLGTADAAGS